VDDNSVAIIITDIPCSNFSLFPDIQEMFGSEKNVTALKNEFEEHNLHGIILWLTVRI
jgi:hypothetical protein